MSDNHITPKMEVELNVIRALKEIYDPEIPVNIFDLGLVYEITVDDNMHVHIVMTLTAPNCPVAESLPVEVEQAVFAADGVRSADVELTFEPPWDESMMSEEAQLELGFY